jgi:hypothetical protein
VSNVVGILFEDTYKKILVNFHKITTGALKIYMHLLESIWALKLPKVLQQLKVDKI